MTDIYVERALKGEDVMPFFGLIKNVFFILGLICL